ncbi:cold-shock protein [Cloacibacterium sp. TD35]|jgi:CspA family cold shock protein|uniref:cold-shock protein n=1 Tax=Cloacibacterium sp. TD35 TaxID=2976818 RepID=UPI00237DFB05|nr:cold-shock protein [Cloacibacterium sp. TD35]WDT67156.1 cold-shock protein [Cloacibacterium sp. TD35]
MQEGTVKFYNETKGFGFITPNNGGDDIFVHSSGLSTRTIKENDKVVYQVTQGQKGLNATQVKLA